MEGAFELEDDDVFFADLSKQISLLIMDDDGDDPLAHCPSVNLQAFTQANHPSTQASFINYDQQTSKRESKGTGVFIPRSSHPRRNKHVKQGKSMSYGNKFLRPSYDYNNSKGPPNMAYNNNNNNINPSHNVRRL